MANDRCSTLDESRHLLTHFQQMQDAQSQCVPCKLCGCAAIITDAGVGAGYYIRCSNALDYRSYKGCLISGQRLGGWAYNVMEWWNRLHATAAIAPVAWMYDYPGNNDPRFQSYEGMSCNEEDAGMVEVALYPQQVVDALISENSRIRMALHRLIPEIPRLGEREEYPDDFVLKLSVTSGDLRSARIELAASEVGQ